MGITPAIAAIVAGGAGLVGSGMQANAATSAANTNAQAAMQAAQIQAQSEAQALQFAKQTAAQNLATQNAMQLGNFNQWKAQQDRLSALGVSQFGLPARQIPAYVPIPTSYGAYGNEFGLPAQNADGTPITPAANPTMTTLPAATVPNASTAQPIPSNSYLNYILTQQGLPTQS